MTHAHPTVSESVMEAAEEYDWLSWEAYTSYKNLCEELDKVLS